MPSEEKVNPLFLGTDSITVHKARELIILLLALGLLTWYSVNVTGLFDASRTWLILGIFASVAVAFSFIIKRIGNFNFNIPIAGRGFLPVPRKYILIFALILFVVTFFFIGRSPYAIFAPVFQLVECNVFCNSVLSVPAAIIEDFIFFSVFYGAIFSLVLLYTKSPVVALVISTISVPFIFLIFHLLVYGFSDVVNSTAVLIFGFEQVFIMLLFRDLIIVHARHVANNLSGEIFSQMSFSGLVLALLNSIWFWVIILILAVGVFLWIKFLRKKNVVGLK